MDEVADELYSQSQETFIYAVMDRTPPVHLHLSILHSTVNASLVHSLGMSEEMATTSPQKILKHQH